MSQIQHFCDFISKTTKYPTLWFMHIKVRQWNFEVENFTDGQFTVKTLKITSLENLYVYGKPSRMEIQMKQNTK